MEVLMLFLHPSVSMLKIDDHRMIRTVQCSTAV